jgi:hypothetical protein
MQFGFQIGVYTDCRTNISFIVITLLARIWFQELRRTFLSLRRNNLMRLSHFVGSADPTETALTVKPSGTFRMHVKKRATIAEIAP